MHWWGVAGWALFGKTQDGMTHGQAAEVNQIDVINQVNTMTGNRMDVRDSAKFWW